MGSYTPRYQTSLDSGSKRRVEPKWTSCVNIFSIILALAEILCDSNLQKIQGIVYVSADWWLVGSSTFKQKSPSAGPSREAARWCTIALAALPKAFLIDRLRQEYVIETKQARGRSIIKKIFLSTDFLCVDGSNVPSYHTHPCENSVPCSATLKLLGGGRWSRTAVWRIWKLLTSSQTLLPVQTSCTLQGRKACSKRRRSKWWRWCWMQISWRRSEWRPTGKDPTPTSSTLQPWPIPPSGSASLGCDPSGLSSHSRYKRLRCGKADSQFCSKGGWRGIMAICYCTTTRSP